MTARDIEAEGRRMLAGAVAWAGSAGIEGPVRDPAGSPLADPQLEELEFERAVSDRLRTLRVEQQARARLDGEGRAIVPAPTMRSLRELLDAPDREVEFRIGDLWPSRGRVMLSAPFKSGKTTMIANLVRSLVDGDSFLGKFDVRPAGRVVLIDDEMDEDHLRRWYRDQGIRNVDAVRVICLRGKLSAFDIMDDRGRKQWADLIGPADVVILDCLRPVLDALRLDENHDAGRFLVAFDALLAEAGIHEGLIVHHTGHDGERARGDSRLRDWPDVEWRLSRDTKTNDMTGGVSSNPRYFEAFGRDVDLPKGQVSWDIVTRCLTYIGGSPTEHRTQQLVGSVVEAVGSRPGINRGDIEEAIGGTAKIARAAIDAAIAQQLITMRREGNRAQAHYLPDQEPPDANSSKRRRPSRPIDETAEKSSSIRPNRTTNSETDEKPVRRYVEARRHATKRASR